MAYGATQLSRGYVGQGTTTSAPSYFSQGQATSSNIVTSKKKKDSDKPTFVTTPGGAGYVKYAKGQKPLSKTEKLTSEYKSAFSKAEKANLARYQEGMEGFSNLASQTQSRYQELIGKLQSDVDARYSKIFGYISQTGAQQEADIRSNYQAMLAKQQAGLLSRGMGGTTVGVALEKGATREQQAELNRLQESLLGQKISAEQSLGQEKAGYLQSLGAGAISDLANIEMQRLGFLERREDAYPSESAYLAMMQQMGEATGMSGGAGGSTQPYSPVTIGTKDQHTSRFKGRNKKLPSNTYSNGSRFEGFYNPKTKAKSKKKRKTVSFGGGASVSRFR